MWARVVEVLLGCWLALSPFIFRHTAEDRDMWRNDFGCAVVVITLALVSFWRPLRYAHLALVLVAFWLIGFSYVVSPRPAPPALQNDAMIGWLLLLFAIVPNQASLPPDGWRNFIAETKTRERMPDVTIMGRQAD